MRGLGDIVTMPLPTDYGPEIFSQAAATGLTTYGLPGSGPGISPGQPLASGPGAAASAPSGAPGTYIPVTFPLTPDAGLPHWAQHDGRDYYPTGAPPGLPPWAIARARARGLPGHRFPDGLVIPPTAVGQGPGNNPAAWMRPPVLPDWMLPPVLQRSNPLLRFTAYRRNQWDNRMLRQAMVWAWIAKHGGLKTCCRVPELGAPIYDEDPRQVMPSQGQEFQQMFSQPITAFQSGGVFTGTDVVLGSFRVPEGYDGCLNRVVFNCTSSGYVDFSGAVFWRVKIGIRYARNLGNVQNTYGSLQTSFLVPGSRIDLVSGQTVFLIANVPAASPITGGVIEGGAFGWLYPRR